jgi:hypothetical protein
MQDREPCIGLSPAVVLLSPLGAPDSVHNEENIIPMFSGCKPAFAGLEHKFAINVGVNFFGIPIFVR